MIASQYQYEPKYGIPNTVWDISEEHLAQVEDSIIKVVRTRMEGLEKDLTMIFPTQVINIHAGGRYSLVAKLDD